MGQRGSVFYEAPKGGAGAGGAKVLVPSLCDPCPITQLSRLALPTCEGSRQVAQVLPTPASPPPSFLGPRSPELTGPQWGPAHGSFKFPGDPDTQPGTAWWSLGMFPAPTSRPQSAQRGLCVTTLPCRDSLPRQWQLCWPLRAGGQPGP